MEKGLSSSSSSSDSLNGLKFGKKIYFEGVASGLEEEAAPPPQSPAKKGRSAVAQPPRCQVEGCKVDLSDAKAYYCRHKVCGMHSKFPKVIVDGLEQRFCQQCSKFHQLPEFDQGKRSCRRRLAGHNERRRKPPQGPLLSSRYSTFSPSTFDAWPNESERQSTNQMAITSKYQFPWQSHSQAPLADLPQGSTAQPSYLSPGLSSGDCFNGVSNSTTALSLLSNTNSFLATNGANNGELSVNPSASVGQFSSSSWDLKGDQANSSLYEMPPDMVLAQISRPSARSDDEQCNELELSGGYGSSVQHMNWSL